MVNGDGLSLAADIGIEMVNCIDFVITRCKIENFSKLVYPFTMMMKKASGLIHNNEFNHNYKDYTGWIWVMVLLYMVPIKKWINDLNLVHQTLYLLRIIPLIIIDTP